MIWLYKTLSFLYQNLIIIIIIISEVRFLLKRGMIFVLMLAPVLMMLLAIVRTHFLWIMELRILH